MAMVVVQVTQIIHRIIFRRKVRTKSHKIANKLLLKRKFFVYVKGLIRVDFLLLVKLKMIVHMEDGFILSALIVLRC